jgi:adenosylmethionine---8-amino-7-oxononanoate aminotransferase
VSGFRTLGMIWAFDVATDRPNFSRQMFTEGLARGVLLRPIGNTVYFMPPYVIDAGEFQFLVDATLAAIDACAA